MRLWMATATATTFYSALVPYCHGFVGRSFVTRASRAAATRQSSSSSLQMTSKTPVRRLGIFGGGTVGGGIMDILDRKSDSFTAITGEKIEVRKLCVKDASKKRDFAIPSTCEVVTDYDSIIDDPEIDMVVEVMGGVDDARDVVYKSLRAGKDVVTANKALIAAYLEDIEKIVKEVNEGADRDTSEVEFRYEAAVCGGIPIIRSMQSDFVGDDITMISGIINGCTNYMLTAMEQKQQSYEQALSDASDLGYAEADPTLDVGGFDARSKLKILIRLAYGIDVDENEISCRGIQELAKVDFEYASIMGGTIKLMGVAKRTNDPNKIAAFVSPTFVTSDETLASVSGATNAVEVMSSNLQSSTYIGQGAGRFPTANSCINDIVSLAKGDKTPLPFNPDSDLQFVNDYESLFFIRIRYRDALGITRQCGEICEKFGVSIHSILQNPVQNRQDAAFVIITERVPLSSVKKVCAELDGLDWCFGESLFMPILHDAAPGRGGQQ